MSATIDFEALNGRGLDNFWQIIDWLNLWEACETDTEGSEFTAINPRRQDLELGSFKINMGTGRWSDFAVGEEDSQGGDIVSYVAYLKGINNIEAARQLTAFLDELEGEEMAATRPQTPVGSVGTTTPAASANDPAYINPPVPAGAPGLPTHFGRLGTPSSAYPYLNLEGALIGYVLRFDLPDGKKTFLPQRFIDGAWTPKGFDKPLPIYNQHLLPARPEAPVLIVEGEKTANAATGLFPGHVVVSWPQGAMSADKVDWSLLNGRDVTIWPDHDEPGRQAAAKIAQILAGHSGQPPVKVVNTDQIRLPVTINPDTGRLEQGEEAISPGWDLADALALGWAAEIALPALAEYGQPYAVAVTTTPVVAPVAEVAPISFGKFTLDGRGVWVQGKKEDEEPNWLCGKMQVAARIRDLQSSGWGALVQFSDQDGIVHECIIPHEKLVASEEVRQTLLREGLAIRVDPAAKTQLANYIQQFPTAARWIAAYKTGWLTESIYVLPERIYGACSEQVHLISDSHRATNPFTIAGSLEDWQSHVGAYCENNYNVVVGLCIAFIGPLLGPLHIENFGVHLRGPTSLGKTKALMVAGSVYGNPAMLKGSWRTTDNALESLAVNRNDNVLLLDELGEVSSSVVGASIYMLGNGQGKARSRTDGSLREIKEFRLVYLSSGEVSLHEHLAGDGRRSTGGQEVRLINLHADAGLRMGIFQDLHGFVSSKDFAEMLEGNSRLYYGSAGNAFLERISAPGEMSKCLRFCLAEATDFFDASPIEAADPEVTRVKQKFAYLAAVGEYAIRLGILAFPEGHARSACDWSFGRWLQERGNADSTEMIRALAQIKQILEQYGLSRFTMDAVAGIEGVTPSIVTPSPRYGHLRWTSGTTCDFWVFTETFQDVFCRGYDRGNVAKYLERLGHMEGHVAVAKRIPLEGTRRVYVIKSSILEGGVPLIQGVAA